MSIQSQKLDLMRSRKGKCKYAKVTSLVRRQFIQKVVTKSCTIKQAAREYHINYSTAKTIYRLYKNKAAQRSALDGANHWQPSPDDDTDSSNLRKQCGYREQRRSPLKCSPSARQRQSNSPTKLLRRQVSDGRFPNVLVISTIGSSY